jgi:hypothetical protein
MEIVASYLLIWWRRQLSGEQRKKICESGLMILDPRFSRSQDQRGNVGEEAFQLISGLLRQHRRWRGRSHDLLSTKSD